MNDNQHCLICKKKFSALEILLFCDDCDHMIYHILDNEKILKQLDMPTPIIPGFDFDNCRICGTNNDMGQMCKECIRKYIIPNLKMIKQMLAMEKL